MSPQPALRRTTARVAAGILALAEYAEAAADEPHADRGRALSLVAHALRSHAAVLRRASRGRLDSAGKNVDTAT